MESLFQVHSEVVAGWIPVEFEGAMLLVSSRGSVAAALLAAGVRVFRSTPLSGEPRAPYCMMGACFECLLEIDGQPNRQACMVPVRPGMRIHRQQGARPLSARGEGPNA